MHYPTPELPRRAWAVLEELNLSPLGGEYRLAEHAVADVFDGMDDEEVQRKPFEVPTFRAR